MKIKFALSILFAGLAGVHGAQAETAVSADLGTTGLGLHVSLPIQPNLNARLGANYLTHSYSGHTSDVNYDFDMKLQTFDALLDYFPGESSFRLSAGLVYNGNQIDAKGKSSSGATYKLGANTYTASDIGTVKGNIDFRKLAPYLGLGWGNPVKTAGWGFTSDLGVLFQGAPSTSLVNTECNLSAAQCTQLATDVAAENVKLNDKVHNFRFYPVLRVGASYRF